jgi:hypothetical protein
VLVSHSLRRFTLVSRDVGDGSKFGPVSLLVELGSKQGHPVIELFPFEEAPKAYERMMSGDARFRL